LKLRNAQNRSKKQICICQWCHEEYRKDTCKKFCSQECRAKHNAIKRRIYKLYPFENATTKRELRKLKELGGLYRFPKPHEGFNDYYRLQLLEKAVKQARRVLK